MLHARQKNITYTLALLWIKMLNWNFLFIFPDGHNLNRKRLKLYFSINHTLEIASTAGFVLWPSIYPMQVYRPVVLSSFRQIPIQIIGRHTKHTLVIDIRIIQTECFIAVTSRLLSIDKNPCSNTGLEVSYDN